jgi:hypothetical protein
MEWDAAKSKWIECPELSSPASGFIVEAFAKQVPSGYRLSFSDRSDQAIFCRIGRHHRVQYRIYRVGNGRQANLLAFATVPMSLAVSLNRSPRVTMAAMS